MKTYCKTITAILCCLAAVIILALVMCPGEQRHKQAICEVADDLFDDDLSSKCSGQHDLWSILTSELGDDAFESVVNSRLVVKKRGIYSIGGIEKDSTFKVLSVGCMGFVFTFDKKELERIIDENNDKMNLLMRF